MIDTQTESLITVPEASRLVPPHGVHVATTWRWALSGLSDGRKLETIKIGGRTYTSREKLNEFLSVSAGDSPQQTSKQRERQIDAASKKLAAYGV